MNNSAAQALLPNLVYTGGRFQSELAVFCDDTGRIQSITPAHELHDAARLKDRALLPGLINTHSHAFQRVIRGHTERRTSASKDSFWTWREMMYSAVRRLTPEDIYDVSRMVFLEMALSGITTVGEFHYLHHAPDGTPYEDPNLLSKQVIRAAREVGLRIALLRVAYARSGYQLQANPLQSRFLETDPNLYLKHLIQLEHDLQGMKGEAWVGVAPHSVRAVPLNYLKEVIGFGRERNLPVQMHLAEQPAEISACIEEYGRSPVSLLTTEGLLSDRFTAVHAIHVTPKAVRLLADARCMICACPTTERNLGDGVVPVDSFMEKGLQVSLGSDSNVQVDLMEDARELEYHLRLQKMGRAVLSPPTDSEYSALATRLFECATVNGARSLSAPGGLMEPGYAADFFTVNLNDPSIAGSGESDLLSSIVFSLSKTAVRDVFVAGKRIVAGGRHPLEEEIVEKFRNLQKRLWQ